MMKVPTAENAIRGNCFPGRYLQEHSLHVVCDHSVPSTKILSSVIQ